ncbi:hypothetical protein ACLBW0_08485 [Enterobacteriaceae bacterium C34A]
MDIKSFLEEIECLKREINKSDELIKLTDEHGLRLVVASANNSNYRAHADQEFLIDAIKSQRTEMQLRLERLAEAVGVVEKVIDGLVA